MRWTATALLAVVVLLMLSGTGGAPAADNHYGWTISYSPTDPYINEMAFIPGLLTLYLWYACSDNDGMVEAEFSVQGSNGADLILAFTPASGWSNAGPAPSGTRVDLLLAVDGCPTGPVQAGEILIQNSSPGEWCVVPAPNGNRVTVDCDPTPTAWPLQAIGFSDAGAPSCVETLCPATSGACCLDMECFIWTEEDCITLGGDYQGDHTSCTPDPCQPPPTSLTFLDQTEFELFMEENGKILKGVETFEESNVPPGGVAEIPFPLDQNPNVDGGGLGFPDGLEQTNITIWDNVTPGPDPSELNPSNLPDGCAVPGVGFNGGNSIKIVNNRHQPSMDMVFSDLNKTGIGFKYSTFLGGGSNPYRISVWNLDGDLITDADAPRVGPEPSKGFFGVWSEEPIGRVNFFDPDGGFYGIDDIQMWLGMPTSAPNVASSSQLRLGIPVPNPATNHLSFDVTLPEPAHVRVAVYDVTGRLVGTPVDESLSAGVHNFGFAARDSQGKTLVGGVYYLLLQTGDDQETRRFIIMK